MPAADQPLSRGWLEDQFEDTAIPLAGLAVGGSATQSQAIRVGVLAQILAANAFLIDDSAFSSRSRAQSSRLPSLQQRGQMLGGRNIAGTPQIADDVADGS